jgi:hypothetical protein
MAATGTPEMRMRRRVPIMLNARTAWRWDHPACPRRRNR